MSDGVAGPGAVALPARPGVTATRVLRAEWVKTWTASTTASCVAATVLLHAAVALVSGYNAAAPAAGGLSGLLSLGLVVSQLPLALLGVVVSAGEHHDGSARSTYLAVPRRLPVLVGRAATVTVVAALAGGLAVAAAWASLLPFADRVGVTLEAPDGDLVRVVAGTVLHLVAVSLLGLALGAIVRRPAAAGVVALVWLLLLDQLLTMLGSEAALAIRAAMPGWAGRLVATPDEGLADLVRAGLPADPWQGYGILVAWTVAALLVAAPVVRRSDV